MAPVTLPPSFYNSFWSADYRTGLEVLFKQLDKGCKEGDDLEKFISAQAEGHHTLARTLFQTPSSPSDSTTSLQHTLLALKSSSSARGEAHRALALELESRVLIGFSQWKDRHAERVAAAKKDALGKGGVIALWEKESKNLASLKQTYATKSRAADDAEDDARFAPPTASSSGNDISSGLSGSVKSPTASSVTSGDSYTALASPQRKSALLQRSGTVADRISEKLRAASISSPLSPSSGNAARKPMLSIDGKHLPAPPTPLGSATPADGHRSPTSPTSPNEDAFIPPSDPNGKPTFPFPSGPPVPSKTQLGGASEKDGPAILEVQPAPILLSGLSLSISALQELLKRFESYILFNPAPHADPSVTAGYTKSNAALASRQKSTILGTYEKTFSGEELTEWLKDNVEGFGGDWERSVDAARELNAMGYVARVGVGRGFEPSDDIFYVLRHDPSASSGPLNAPAAQSAKQYGTQAAAQAAAAFKDLQKQNPLSPATSANLQNMIKTYVPTRFAPSDEPLHVRLRRDASVADDKYRDAVRSAEDKRLEMEQMIERGLRTWERWERERLDAFRGVLIQYDQALARLPARISSIQSQTHLSIETFNPNADLRSLIEDHRTGPFKPQAHVYESLEVDQPDVSFGIDLKRWAGETGWKAATSAPKREKGAVPGVLEGLLSGISALDEGLPDEEKRKSWIYEVPLPQIHGLRNSINHADLQPADIVEICKKFNAPIVAGTVKLWLLELNPPVMGWEGWEDAKAIYPAVGADQERDMTSAVTSVLSRLPGAQLFVLDAVVGHLRRLVDNTKSEESAEVYMTKLALGLGRCILRPQIETDLTIGDRTPSLFFADLVTLYSSILPPLVQKKKQEADRVMPVRKRTQLVDQRPSRRNISEDDTHRTLFERQAHINKDNQEKEKEKERESKGKGRAEGEVPEKRSSPQSSAAPAAVATIAPATAAEAERPFVPATAGPVGSSAPAAQERPQSTAAPVPTKTEIAPPIPAVQPGVPVMAEPADSDDEDQPFQPPSFPSDPSAGPTAGAPPTLPPIGSSTGAATGEGQGDGEGDNSMADILDSYADAEDQPIAGANTTASGGAAGISTTGASGLKRATSGDTGSAGGSRLRGPRGARGPRPAGARGLGQGQQAGEEEGETGRESPVDGVRRGHAAKSSVSAMAARFEQSR